ncbi:hypothetical protein ASG81_09360 [Paenibacillus sp. Soil522]|nr:hypothetical protein [Paenibacillus sp. Soil522]KRE47072.1 hypothetical protein ASG81_09360 [Paenibacillus sp. Soil522]
MNGFEIVGWEVEIETEMILDQDAHIAHSILYKDLVIVAASERVAAERDSISRHRLSLSVENPLLWNTDDPELYQLVTEL